MVLIWGSILGVIFSISCFLTQRYHFLSILLRLEVATISLFALVLSQGNFLIEIRYPSLVYITLGACEASLGLAILVGLLRVRGNDYVSRFSSMKC